MKKLLAVLMIVSTIGLVSCKNDGSADYKDAMTVEQMQEKFAELVGKEVKVTGSVVHVCKHGGTKMFLMGQDTNISIKIDAGESGNFKADEVEGMDVGVIGTVVEFKVTEDDVQKMEADLADMKTKVDTTKTAEIAEHENCDMSKKNEAERAEVTPNDIVNLQADIDFYRGKMQESGKNYVSFYSIKCSKYKVFSKENEKK